MTFIVDGTNGLTFNNSTTQASAGVVLQVVQGTTNTIVTTTSAILVNTGFSASITPKFSTSKILVTASLPATIVGAGLSAFFTIYRNGVNQAIGGGTSQSFAQIYSTGNVISNETLCYLDSPATTSSTTYAIYWYTNGSATFCNNNVTATIILQEIAG